MADKKVILQFKKSASTEEKAKFIEELKSTKGAQVTNDDNVNSRIMPFVAFALPENHFDTLRSDALGGEHAVVEHVEEDQEMRIQS